MQNKHWIQGDNLCESPLFRRDFFLKQLPVSANISICGLGYFLLFVNGQRVGTQEFTPAFTCYSSTLGSDTTYPVWEERTSYRSFYLTFDLLPYLEKGKNVIGIQLGNGWYHQTKRTDEGNFIFGFPKLRYELNITFDSSAPIFMESDPKTLWKPSEITANNLFYGEVHDLRLFHDDWCTVDADLSEWKPAKPTHAPQTTLVQQCCPADRVIRSIVPIPITENNGKIIYDCQENISGWVSILCDGAPGEVVSILHSEELSANQQQLDLTSAGGCKQPQRNIYICDGHSRTVRPKFCWQSFRYFEVEGPGKVISASLVCNDIPITSSFHCSDPTLNWLFDAYIRTQRNNYHNCIPSDCPHRERLGYTGDGQLTAETAMLTLGTKQLYEKWYQDILDCQGIDTGHIPHTAPFMGGGGGPGGWGSAIYIIPVSYYHIYNDTTLIKKGYPAILRWLEYMHSHTENGIVTHGEAGGWFLGEWCEPADAEPLPPAFINTYYYIRGLLEAQNMAKILGNFPPAWIAEYLSISMTAFQNTFFDPETQNFCNGAGAANAFALNLSMGSSQTKKNLIDKYKKLGKLDTGIFGTPVLLEYLFQNGEATLAYHLMVNDSPISFSHMMKNQATTLWERWDGSDSHDHPMFGSVVKLLFTEILGIHQKSGSSGFLSLNIQPANIIGLDWAEGSIKTVAGTIKVSWKRNAAQQIITQTQIIKEE